MSGLRATREEPAQSFAIMDRGARCSQWPRGLTQATVGCTRGPPGLMDLNTAQAVVRVGAGPDGLRWPPGEAWQPGDAWLAGGSWLFSEPQPGLRRLVDLADVAWPALTVGEEGLEIAATCTLAELFALAPASDGVRAQPSSGRLPPDWEAARLIAPCCRALRGSFKVWNVATVGGNLCLALPAGPMISLTAALAGVCTIWGAGGGARRVPVTDFVLGGGRVRAGRRRAAALDHAPGGGAALPAGAAPALAARARALGGAAHRPARAGRRVRADRDRGDAPPRAPDVRRAAGARRARAALSAAPWPTRPGSTTSTARRRGARTSRGCTPRRSGASSPGDRAGLAGA